MKKECKSQVSLVGAYSITLKEDSPVLFILGEHLEIGILHRDMIYYLDGKSLDPLRVKKVLNDCPFNIFPLSEDFVHGMWDTLEIVWRGITGCGKKDSQKLLYEGKGIDYSDLDSIRNMGAIYERNRKALTDADNTQYAKGEILYRYLSFPVADGNAVYQIVSIVGDMALIRHCPGLGDDYQCEYGEEAVIMLEEAKAHLRRRDLWKAKKE